MAVRNVELIASACMDYKITETVKTLPQWNKAGYRIKAGSKALFKIKIWKPCKQKITDENGNAETVQKLRLVDAYFFGMSQVERIQ